MPTDLVVSVSPDGVDYREVGRVVNQVPDDRWGVVRAEMVVDAGGEEARYVRLVAHSYGTIPDWHPGHGGAAFIFVDEILIE